MEVRRIKGVVSTVNLKKDMNVSMRKMIFYFLVRKKRSTLQITPIRAIFKMNIVLEKILLGMVVLIK